MSTSEMAVDRPAKIDVDSYLTTVLSTAPHELHQYFEAFRTLHQRKSVELYFRYIIMRLTLYDTQAMASAHVEALRVLQPRFVKTVPSGHI